MATSRSEKQDTTTDEAASTPNTGGSALVEGNDDNGATKSYLGHDAADLQKDGVADEQGVVAPAEVKPTTFEGAQPPPGHVNDPTSEGHVGSAG